MRPHAAPTPMKTAGFTLVELIAVVVIMGIITALGSSFLVSNFDSYMMVESRSHMVQRGNLIVEQMSRSLRMAAPNSVRVSGTGQCIEYLPVVAGANYQGQVPDQANGMSTTASIATGEFNLGYGQPQHVILAPFDSSEIYTAASTAARVAVGALGSEPITTIPLASSHRFLRNSTSFRVYLVDHPERFCLSSSTLTHYSQYGFSTSPISDSSPGGVSAIFGQNISTSSTLFTVSPSSENRRASVLIKFNLTKGTNTLTFNHEVLIRNVP